MSTPVLETDRLILRGHALADFDDCMQMWANETVTKYTIGKPSTEQQTWARVLNYVGHWALMGFGYWAVEGKAKKRFIGELGFADFKRDISPSIRGLPEMGWALTPEAHGKGYAREAITAALSWGDQNLKSTQVVCIINPENAKSFRLAESFGFTKAQNTVYLGSPVKLLQRNKPK